MELGRRGPHGPVQLLFFAVPEEAGPFRRAWEKSGAGTWRREPSLERGGAWRSGNIVVIVTGMGSRNARRVASRLVEVMSIDWVVTAGFAGGLDPRLSVGTVGYCADPSFPARAGLDTASARPMAFLEVDRVAVTPEEKAALHLKSGADAVEMESGTIRALCRERGIPSATVRVISDAAGDALPLDFGALMTADDQLDFRRLAWMLACSPGKIPDLIRFQRKVARAADELARVMVALMGR